MGSGTDLTSEPTDFSQMEDVLTAMERHNVQTGGWLPVRNGRSLLGGTRQLLMTHSQITGSYSMERICQTKSITVGVLLGTQGRAVLSLKIRLSSSRKIEKPESINWGGGNCSKWMQKSINLAVGTLTFQFTSSSHVQCAGVQTKWSLSESTVPKTSVKFKMSVFIALVRTGGTEKTAQH